MWASKLEWEMSVKSRCPCGRVGLCRLRQRKVNVCLHTDMLSCAGYVGGKKTSVCVDHDREKKMSADDKKRHPDERINVCVDR